MDLSHPIRAGMETYPGLPAPRTADHLSFDQSRSHYDEGTEFQISEVSMVTSTGTYLDAPRHRFRDGADVGSIPLERCAVLPTVVVDVRGLAEIGAEALPPDLAGCAVLFCTGWDRHWGTARYGSHEHPRLRPSAAEQLVQQGAVLAGIDSVNVDGTVGGARPIHTTLLAAGVLVVENLTRLQLVPARGAAFSAVPLAFEGLPSFPVRAFATA